MDTLSPARTRCHTRLRITTHRSVEFFDLTEELDRLVSDSGLSVGTLNVQTLHTTSAVVVNEHEPLLLEDFEALLERAAPARAVYAHDDLFRRRGVSDEEPRNGHAHCRALLLPSSVLLNVGDGRLVLGRWQRVFFVELDGPRVREVSVVLTGEAAR